MSIIFEDNHRCEKCMRRFNWIYFKSARSKLGSGLPVAEAVPKSPMAHCVETMNDTTYRIYINCPHCDHENIFIYNEE